MNPLLDRIIRDLAHGEGASALPHAPVVTETAPRAARLRLAVGATLHTLARHIEPRDARRVEAHHYRTA